MNQEDYDYGYEKGYNIGFIEGRNRAIEEMMKVFQDSTSPQVVVTTEKNMSKLKQDLK